MPEEIRLLAHVGMSKLPGRSIPKRGRQGDGINVQHFLIGDWAGAWGASMLLLPMQCCPTDYGCKGNASWKVAHNLLTV